MHLVVDIYDIFAVITFSFVLILNANCIKSQKKEIKWSFNDLIQTVNDFA